MKKLTAISISIIALVIIIAYWQVISLNHPILWDTPEAFFPFRYYISECTRHGFLPIWTPYTFTGYPFFADPQSGCWYPIAWLLGSLGRYTLATSNIEYILSIFIGACGMYQLAKKWAQDNNAALFAGISYACCGVFVGNAEHLSWVISAAWLPWLFWAYYQMVQKLDVKYAALFAIILFLMASGGYTVFLIISFYLFIFLSLAVLFSKQNRPVHKKRLWLHIALVVLSIGCCCIVLYSYTIALAESTRTSGIPLKLALTNPFSLHSFSSFLLPFASFKDNAWYKTDPSMSNAYFGVISFALFLFALSGKKDKRFWMVLALSLLCMFASVGDALPFRAFLFGHVPLMNLFRFPAVFRLFFIIGFILLAAGAFRDLKNDLPTGKKRIITILILLLLFFVGASFYSFNKMHGLYVHWTDLYLHTDDFGQNSFYTHILKQSVIQFAVLVLFGATLIFKWNPKYSISIILIICALDLTSSVHKNMYGTILSTVALKEVNNKIKNCPTGFPIPDNTIPIIRNSDNNYKEELNPVTNNTLLLKKVLGKDGYDPFVLARFEQVDESNIKDSLWANPPAYFAANALLLNNKSTLPHKNDVLIDSSAYDKIRLQFAPAENNDSVYFSAFAPNKMTLHTRASGQRLLVLQQNNIPGWNVKIDGNKAKWYHTNIAYMSVLAPTGVHEIEFEFMPRYLLAALVFSLVSILICIVIIVYRNTVLKKRSPPPLSTPPAQ